MTNDTDTNDDDRETTTREDFDDLDVTDQLETRTRQAHGLAYVLHLVLAQGGYDPKMFGAASGLLFEVASEARDFAQAMVAVNQTLVDEGKAQEASIKFLTRERDDLKASVSNLSAQVRTLEAWIKQPQKTAALAEAMGVASLVGGTEAVVEQAPRNGTDG